MKVFLSHCGWGGITDTLMAGKPTLAYPSFSVQKGNAQRLLDLGAALVLDKDFENLLEATTRLLEDVRHTKRNAFEKKEKRSKNDVFHLFFQKRLKRC